MLVHSKFTNRFQTNHHIMESIITELDAILKFIDKLPHSIPTYLDQLDADEAAPKIKAYNIKSFNQRTSQLVSQLRLNIKRINPEKYWTELDQIREEFNYIHSIMDEPAGNDYKKLEASKFKYSFKSDLIQDLIKTIEEYPKQQPKTITENPLIESLSDILNNMFPLAKFELETLINNLHGNNTYIALNYKGTKTKLWKDLGKLRRTGIDRNVIAFVFSKYCTWQRTVSSESKTLNYNEINKKLKLKG